MSLFLCYLEHSCYRRHHHEKQHLYFATRSQGPPESFDWVPRLCQWHRLPPASRSFHLAIRLASQLFLVWKLAPYNGRLTCWLGFPEIFTHHQPNLSATPLLCLLFVLQNSNIIPINLENFRQHAPRFPWAPRAQFWEDCVLDVVFWGNIPAKRRGLVMSAPSRPAKSSSAFPMSAYWSVRALSLPQIIGLRLPLQISMMLLNYLF